MSYVAPAKTHENEWYCICTDVLETVDTYECVVSNTNELCHTWMSNVALEEVPFKVADTFHGAFKNDRCVRMCRVIHEWVMSHMNWFCCIWTGTIESCRHVLWGGRALCCDRIVAVFGTHCAAAARRSWDTGTYIYIYVHMYLYIYIFIYVWILKVYIYTYIYLQIWIHTYIYMYMYIHL